jgi:hypothetical protein
MKLSYLLALLFAGGALAIGQARAQDLYFDLSGTFDSTVPTTSVSAPNATFDLQFSLPQNVKSAPGFYDFGYQFEVGDLSKSLGNLPESYTLGDNPPVTTASNPITSEFSTYEFTANSPSINNWVDFNIFLQDAELHVNFLSNAGVYSGLASDPAIIPGTYTSPVELGEVVQVVGGNPTWTGAYIANQKLVISTSPFSPVPETSQLVLVAGVIASAVGFTLLRRGSQRARALCG